uniref:Uncharacterized protein n=1 Tax=Metopus es TaxID=392813 RepID=A6MI39_9CILI|nr:hypothetical protein [Metopus es]
MELGIFDTYLAQSILYGFFSAKWSVNYDFFSVQVEVLLNKRFIPLGIVSFLCESQMAFEVVELVLSANVVKCFEQWFTKYVVLLLKAEKRTSLKLGSVSRSNFSFSNSLQVLPCFIPALYILARRMYMARSKKSTTPVPQANPATSWSLLNISLEPYEGSSNCEFVLDSLGSFFSNREFMHEKLQEVLLHIINVGKRSLEISV